MRTWSAFEHARKGFQFFTGSISGPLFCSPDCATRRGITAVHPVASSTAEKLYCSYCGRLLFRPRGMVVSASICAKSFQTELMSRADGPRRVRFSPLQARVTGFRFADELPNGEFLGDTTAVGWGNGPLVTSPDADLQDPDEDCLDLDYAFEEGLAPK